MQPLASNQFYNAKLANKSDDITATGITCAVLNTLAFLESPRGIGLHSDEVQNAVTSIPPPPAL
jgi:hypothetical protein